VHLVDEEVRSPSTRRAGLRRRIHLGTVPLLPPLSAHQAGFPRHLHLETSVVLPWISGAPAQAGRRDRRATDSAIVAQLGTADFVRLRVGIGKPSGPQRQGAGSGTRAARLLVRGEGGAPGPARPHGGHGPSLAVARARRGDEPPQPTLIRAADLTSARAAGAPAASWPSFFAPPPPRPFLSTCAFPPGLFPSLGQPPRSSSTSGECSPSLETPVGSCRPHDRPARLYPPPSRALSNLLRPHSRRPSPPSKPGSHATSTAKPRLFFLGSDQIRRCELHSGSIPKTHTPLTGGSFSIFHPHGLEAPRCEGQQPYALRLETRLALSRRADAAET
jgi:hypothetical protein